MELYLDCNATTPVAPEVVDAMAPYWGVRMGNPSSSHRFGRMARQAVEQAREQVAQLLRVTPKQVIFTASGTEANHLAIRGMAETVQQPGVIAVGATEHPSLFGAVDAMVAQGWQMDELVVDRLGRITDEAIEIAARRAPALISTMVANNETGVIQPLAPIQHLAERCGARLHLDATQAAGKIDLDFDELKADCVTLSAHKLYGPKGVGALVVEPSARLVPQMTGGGQERGVRAGTENVPAIVGFGAAAELARSQLQQRIERLQHCRHHLEQGLMQISGVEIVAQQAERLPNTVMCLVSAMEGETLLMQLDRQGIALSSGSACQVGKTAPSRTLSAMGVDPQRARNAIRISLCRDVTVEQIDYFLVQLRQILSPSLTTWEAVA